MPNPNLFMIFNRNTMKNITLFLIASLCLLKLEAQQQIMRYQDDMTDKVYYLTTEGLVVKSEDGKKGFRVELDIKETDDKTITSNGITIKVANIGNCYENDVLIMLFENGEKISLTSWNKFNCDGNSWFHLNEDYTTTYTDILKTQKLVKIRFENGYSHESLTREIPVNSQSFFIELYKLISENKVVPYKEN
jgi:hypothetical protein